MIMTAAPTPRRTRLLANPALVATILIPALAVAGSLFTVALAVLHGDRELPEQYHWEGFKLERDFVRFQRAVELDVRASLEVGAASRLCHLRLRLTGAPPAALDLALVHATIPALDRRVRLVRNGDRYEGRCDPAPAGSWRIELADVGQTWQIRQNVRGSLTNARLTARAAGT